MKDTVVLVNFLPSFESGYENVGCIYPATGILLVGSYLRKNGYNVHIIDGAYYQDYKEQLESAIHETADRIVFVGMSVMVTQIHFALESSKIVKKKNADIPIVWGGAHPTLYPEQTLCDDHVDIVVINEGAYTASKIAQSLVGGTDLRSINGIGYKDAGKVIHLTPASSLEVINNLPFFDFSLIATERYMNPRTASVYKREFPHYKSELRIMPILTGLGCPYKCQFCINVILKRRYRYRSARSIADEIKFLKAKFMANTFLFLDEDFFINKARILALASICEAEDLHFNFRTWCRVDHFKESYLNVDLLKRLSNIGHMSLAMGAESASSEILIDLKKGIKPEQTINSLKIITESDKRIFARYSFMVGLENETMSQIRETYRFCRKMKKINPEVDIAGPFIFRMYPGSPIFKRIVENYDINIPTSLESWALHMKTDASAEEMPWTPREFQKNKDLISFCGDRILPSYAGRQPWSFKGLARTLLVICCKFRIKHFFFTFPIEYWLFSLLKTRLR